MDVSIDPSTSWLQLVEQGLGLLQVKRDEALGEPVVDRGEEITSFGALALITPEAGEADGGAQLPRLRLLRTGSLDRPPIGKLRLIRSAWLPLQKQIAHHSMDFRFPNVVAGAADLHDRRLEHRQGFFSFPVFFEALRK